VTLMLDIGSPENRNPKGWGDKINTTTLKTSRGSWGGGKSLDIQETTGPKYASDQTQDSKRVMKNERPGLKSF